MTEADEKGNPEQDERKQKKLHVWVAAYPPQYVGTVIYDSETRIPSERILGKFAWVDSAYDACWGHKLAVAVNRDIWGQILEAIDRDERSIDYHGTRIIFHLDDDPVDEEDEYGVWPMEAKQ
jgi:hypothetical protein